MFSLDTVQMISFQQSTTSVIKSIARLFNFRPLPSCHTQNVSLAWHSVSSVTLTKLQGHATGYMIQSK